MTLAMETAPTTAERIRSACAGADGALLAVNGVEPVTPPVHHLLADGSFALAVPAGGALADCAKAPAMLELTDYAPLRLREPVRALVWIRGLLQQIPAPAVGPLLDVMATEHPNPALLDVQTLRSPMAEHTLLRLTIDSVVVADASGAESVQVNAFLAAAPDPFWAVESCWVQHVAAQHPEILARLAARLPATLRRGDVRLLGVDRYGVRLRVESADNDHDVRLPFFAPVHDVAGLNRAIRALMGCPFANGLRARRH